MFCLKSAALLIVNCILHLEIIIYATNNMIINSVHKLKKKTKPKIMNSHGKSLQKILNIRFHIFALLPDVVTALIHIYIFNYFMCTKPLI